MKLKLLIVALFCSVLGWGQTTIAIQDFETSPATPTWSYTNSGGGVSTTNTGTPNNQRIRNGLRSFQINNVSSTLTFNDINVSGYNSVSVIIRVSSISVTSGNGADAPDFLRAFVKLDAGSFLANTQANANISVNGNSNARWGYNATGTSTNVGTNVVVAGTSGTNAGTVYSTLIINIPDGTSTVGLRLNALNDDSNEIWCIDDVEIIGTPASSNTITTGTGLSGSPFCVNSSTGASVSVPFTSVGTFNAGNVFTAELSNASGAFPGTAIGTLSASGVDPSGTISATIPAGTAAGTGYRIRVVSNNPTVLGSDNTVNLTVQNSAAITAQPSTSTQTMCQGVGAAALSVTATGTTLSYQWYSNTTATTSGGTPVGTSSASYTPVTTATGTLYYYCVVSAACGASVTSNVSGAVNVNPIPADPTGSITISANPSCGPATLSYPAGFYWQTTASGTSITNPTSSNYILNATGTIYVRSYNGSCWSTNSINTGVITINTPINISVQPTNQSIGDGSNTTFSVTATGTTPTYQWQVDTGSGFVDLANGAPYSNVTTATMTITGATLAMNGYLYRCVVSGVVPCASVISNSATLTVNTVPEINVLSSGTTINDNDLSSAIGDNTDFGSTDISTGTIVKTFTIENLGLGVLNLTGTPLVAISGTHAADFTLTAIPSTPIASSGSTTFQITFNPSALGIRDAVLTIANNDSNENPYNFSVQGRGTTREINVRGNAVDILDGDNTPSLTDDTDFGSVNIASGTIVKTFTIQNTSFSPNGGVLNLTDPSPYVVISGPDAADFSLTVIPSTPIAVSGSTTFQITFNPTTAGVKNATISIANDDSNENPYNFDIRGTGTDTPDIVLSSANPAVASSTIVQSVNNHVIYAFDLAVTTFNATLNNVVFNTSGTYAASSITNFKLWYSTDATFNSATDTFLDNETATLGAGSHTFTGFTRLITNGSTGYFFITTDIPCTATAGHTIIVDAITTADLTFVAGNKSGTAFASGTHTIQSAIPNNVTGAVTSVCENGTATISWTAPAGCRDNVLVFATSGTFTAAIPTGNGGAYTDNAVFGSGTAFDGGFTVFKGTGTSVTVTGLTNGSTYRFKIFTRNDLNWSNGVEVSCTPVLTYCASGATNSTNSEIENVTLVGYSSTISNNTTNACTTGVNNYTAMSADLAVGGSYTLTVEFGDCNGGNQYDGAGGVWIDWNNDGDFLDANETIGTVDLAMTLTDTNVIQNFTINVPAGQPIGNYRMRIVQEEAGAAGTISPCGTFSWGSTEDYTIEVINACTPTTSVSSIFPTSGPVGTVVTINGSGFATATSVSFGSIVASFNIISNTVIEVIVPTGATTGNIVIQDAGSCNLSYSSFTVITKDVSSCEGAPVTTDLIIYELHDEFTGDGGFITLYNGTAATVNLSNYRIYRAGDYGAAMSNYATLTGSIAPGALGVVTVDAASCGNATNGDLNAGFNENDQIQLRNAAGTIVIDDVHAYITGPGYYMVRNAGALSARTTFVAADWSTTPLVAGQCIPSAGLVPPSGTGDSPAVTLNPVDVNASCSSSTATLSVAGTEGVAGGASLAYQWYVNVPGNAGWTAVANGGVYSGATTTTLNISSTSGLNNYQYYCQIRENDATCYTATEAAIVKEGATIWDGTSWSNGVPTLTKLAIINGNYDTTANGNFSCCSLIVNASFVLDIRANDYVEIQNDLTVNGTLNVLNNGSLVQISDAGINTGNISYQRIASAKLQDYVYWSSPVSGFDVNSISPATPAYYHWEWNPTILNPNGGEGNWVNASTTMLGGKGYIVRAPNGFSNAANQNWTATFNNGVPNNGVYTPSIARGTNLNAGTAGPNGVMRLATDDNWNLLGNPYPSAISINSFLIANTQLDGFVRLWTHGTLPTSTVDPFYNNFVYNYTSSDYIAINGAGATSGPGTLSVIGGGQGFFVLMNPGTATTSTATFNNAMRNIGYSNSQFYRSANVTNAGVGGDIERHRIWLDLISPTNETTRTLVAYVDGATAGKDRMFDALTDYKSAQNFYSLIADQVMTIQGKGLPFEQEDRVPLGVKIPSNGAYKIAIGAVDGLFAGNQNIYLEDKVLGVIHDLRSNPYSFSANAGEVNNRFVLRYTNETLGGEDFINNSDVLIFSSDVISVNAMSRTIQNVKIYNVLGQLLLDSDAVNSDTFETSKLQKNNTTLLVQVTLENGIKVTKKIVF